MAYEEWRIAGALEASREKLGSVPDTSSRLTGPGGRLLCARCGRGPEPVRDDESSVPRAQDFREEQSQEPLNPPSVDSHWGSAERAQVPAVRASHPSCALSQPPTSRDSSGQGPVQGEGLGVRTRPTRHPSPQGQVRGQASAE